jgi:hypothetical protein
VRAAGRNPRRDLEVCRRHRRAGAGRVPLKSVVVPVPARPAAMTARAARYAGRSSSTSASAAHGAAMPGSWSSTASAGVAAGHGQGVWGGEKERTETFGQRHSAGTRTVLVRRRGAPPRRARRLSSNSSRRRPHRASTANRSRRPPDLQVPPGLPGRVRLQGPGRRRRRNGGGRSHHRTRQPDRRTPTRSGDRPGHPRRSTHTCPWTTSIPTPGAGSCPDPVRAILGVGSRASPTSTSSPAP